jgi:hypothetical protein
MAIAKILNHSLKVKRFKSVIFYSLREQFYEKVKVVSFNDIREYFLSPKSAYSNKKRNNNNNNDDNNNNDNNNNNNNNNKNKKVVGFTIENDATIQWKHH